LAVNGRGGYEDYTGKTEVKGRGNSTWGYPKKPYRLKLNKKAEICGLGKAKNYVLLANHLDPTLMLNSVAFKIGRLLELPFTNHAIPVDVVLNSIIPIALLILCTSFLLYCNNNVTVCYFCYFTADRSMNTNA
jgi:hypothetical protein